MYHFKVRDLEIPIRSCFFLFFSLDILISQFNGQLYISRKSLLKRSLNCEILNISGNNIHSESSDHVL